MNNEQPDPPKLDDDGNPIETVDPDFKYFDETYLVEGYLSMVWI